MNATDYLRNRLTTCGVYRLTDDDRARITSDGIEAFIYRALTNKKYRKWALDEVTRSHVKEAIRINVRKGAPIALTFPFGAYKLWRFPTSPEVDWAEFFTISYFSEYVAPIAAAYTPGVRVIFSSDDAIVERMNNIPRADTESYIKSFNVLLGQFHPHLPDNFHIELARVSDLFPNQHAYERALERQIPIARKKFETMDPQKRDKRNKTSELNIRWDGAADLTQLTDEEKRERITNGPVLHDAHCDIPERLTFVFGDDRIILFSNPNRKSIPIGTTKSSRTKFWTGFGVLERRGGEFLDRILSPEQYEKMKSVEHEIVPLDFIPLKNFSEIAVYSRQFDFS